VIATGSDASIPPIEGLEEAGYWTNREATQLTEVPDDVVVLGGGPVGIELGQMLRRYGARVTIVEAAGRLLAREDPRVGELIAEQLRAEGIELHLGSSAEAVATSDGRRSVRLSSGEEVGCQELIVAVGREPRGAK